MPSNNRRKKKIGRVRDMAATSSPSPSPSTTTAATATVATIPPFRFCYHSPAACDKCFFSFTPGCLHTLLREEADAERNNSVDIRKYYMPVIYRNMNYNSDGRKFCRERCDFWNQPENAPYVNERMVRVLFYMAVKVLVGKDSIIIQNVNNHRSRPPLFDYKREASNFFHEMLLLYGIVYCGSTAAAKYALENKSCMLGDDEKQKSFRLLWATILDRHQGCHHGLVYIMNELLPCNCLEAEVEYSLQEEEKEEDAGNRYLSLFCSNHCGEFECSSDDDDDSNVDNDDDYDQLFKWCRGCRLTQYCCRRCYKDHWRGDSVEGFHTTPHKVACKAIQELKSFLVAGSTGGTTGGPASSSVVRDI